MTKYVLKYLELHCRPTPTMVTSALCEVEHILPKKPDGAHPHAWSYAQDPATGQPNPLHGELVHQIGNQILLEQKINNRIQNAEFLTKRNGSDAAGRRPAYPGYKASGFAHAEKLCRKRKWTQQDIRKRTEDLIADAKVVWSF